MFNINKKEKGFTLVEIMVVLVILGVLAAISVPVYSNYVRKAKVNEAVANVAIYGNAMRIYRMEKGQWPATKAAGVASTDLKINVDEYYFQISWTKSSTTSQAITVQSTGNLDVSGTMTYTIDENYKGTWTDASGTLYTDYIRRN